MCQTTDRKISQKQAAIEAVKRIGLNQIKEVERAWFRDQKMADIFFDRLRVLKEI